MMTNHAALPPCLVCGQALTLRSARGRKSRKAFLMLVCPENARHFRGSSPISPTSAGCSPSWKGRSARRSSRRSASHAATVQNIYPVTIELQGFPLHIDVPRAVGANLAPQGLVALLGRDFLLHCSVHYNGPGSFISIAW